MTLSKREEIARAIYGAGLKTCTHFDELDAGTRQLMFAKTDAVLAVLREPTADMCERGPYIDEINPNVPPITPSQAEACWQAMIDAAGQS